MVGERGRAARRRREQGLILGYRHLGDTLFILPAIVALGQKLGPRSLDLVTARGLETLFVGNPYLRRLYLTERVRTVELLALLPKFQKESYQSFFLFRHTFANALVGVALGAPARVGLAWKGVSGLLTHRIPYDASWNERDRYLALAGAYLGEPVEAPRSILFFKKGEEKKVEEELGALVPPGRVPVGVYPGSSSQFPVKRWGVEKYASLCLALRRTVPELFFLYFSGKEREEEALCEELRKRVGEGVCVGRVPGEAPGATLRRMALLFSKLFCFLGNDTGPAHLAAAAGTRVFIFNGPQRKEKVALRGAQVSVIEHQVFCRPCKRKTCPHHICLEHLSVDLALQTLLPFFERTLKQESPSKVFAEE